MRELECGVCGDTVLIPEMGEQVTKGETALEHMARTGHPHVYEPDVIGP